MPALVAGIHVLLRVVPKDVDGRVKPGHNELRDRYQSRVAAASQPNTLKSSGFRSRLYSATSPAALFTFSQTSAMRSSRRGSARAAVMRADNQSRTASTK